ncbi:ComEC/Rec2 family competence protein [Catalinimonas niigatensis]|uniref:ComEC/Rec2 family competence protein n=1 Tax=Catalinimonas niigatensis TaxID=1397264 RepID=UPI0026654387|nr:ComEC/Rec2 family competence protein [Catalinimonas niigatensis]WPP49933.1 ComEC/Rec2 family competence protein [Catalinimonas niigatensis]
MFKWVPYPFLRLTPVLISGILAANYLHWRLPLSLLLTTWILYTLLAFGIPKQYRYKWANWVGMAGLLWLFVTSWFYVQHRQDDRQEQHLGNISIPYTHYVATVKEPSEPKKNSYQAVAEVDYLVQRDSVGVVRTTPAKGKIILYQPKNDSLSTFVYGDQILIQGQAQRIKPPANPHEFDYRQFLIYQHIYHQHYLPKDQWTSIGSNISNPLISFAYTARSRCRQVFAQGISDPQARGIAQALVLGIKTELDDEIRNAYAAAGAMHVLAVSGLHVGIIYLVLSFLLKPLEHIGKGGHVLKAVLCLLALWAYALLTGLSPSVMRAALMFSFIIVAEATRRQTNIYNTIAASAFFLLLFDPYLLMSVGFQLSYLAVLGIVYLQPKIYRWFNPENRWLDWLWGLTAVSIAAQLATFPLGLYYFQQFPIYFWLSNIIVIPAAYLILSLGLLCFAVGLSLPSLLTYPGWLLEKVIQVTNLGVLWIEQLPVSVLKGIYFSSGETLLLYGAIGFLLMLFYYRRFKYVWMLSGCIGLMLTIHVLHIAQEYQKTSITFYQVPKESRLDLSSGRTNLHLGNNDSKAMYHILPNQIYRGVKTSYLSDSTASSSLAVQPWKNMLIMVWKGKKIAMVREPFDGKSRLTEKLPVDVVVVCNNALTTLASLDSYFNYQKLIIDSSNSHYRAAKLAQEAEELNISYHCVPLQGAYEYLID